MQHTFAAGPGDVAGLLREATSQGYNIVLVPPGSATLDALTVPPHGKSARTAIRRSFGLTQAESKAFLALITSAEGEHVTGDELRAAITCDGDPVPKSNVTGVIIHKLRKKLAARDIEIVTVWGLGYRLAEDSHDKIRKLLDAECSATATPAADKNGKVKEQAA